MGAIDYSVSAMTRFRSMLGAPVKQPAHAGLAPCIPWRGKRDADGHGRFYLDGEAMRASRASYMIFVGQVPRGHVVRHRCDNAACVNPLHLETGTHAVNVADRVARGRSARGDRHGARLHPESRPRGEGVWSHRLTIESVASIRSRAKAGEPESALAREFGVTQSTISKVVLRRTWRHV